VGPAVVENTVFLQVPRGSLLAVRICSTATTRAFVSDKHAYQARIPMALRVDARQRLACEGIDRFVSVVPVMFLSHVDWGSPDKIFLLGYVGVCLPT
jgi:hypothetical protein